MESLRMQPIQLKIGSKITTKVDEERGSKYLFSWKQSTIKNNEEKKEHGTNNK